MRKPIRHAQANNLAAAKRSIVTICGGLALVLGTTSVGPSLFMLPSGPDAPTASSINEGLSAIDTVASDKKESDSLTRQRMLVLAPQKPSGAAGSQPFLPASKTKSAGEISLEVGASKTTLLLELTQKVDTTTTVVVPEQKTDVSDPEPPQATEEPAVSDPEPDVAAEPQTPDEEEPAESDPEPLYDTTNTETAE